MARLSANLEFLWLDLPLLKRIAAAAQVGFRAVELHWPYDTPAIVAKRETKRNSASLWFDEALAVRQ
ncbi:hypothetical protein [Mesorhizobium sp. B2-4-17]|uniref:hypothetical protein n=1 Tax=Mesorhizobium sp. B2-4-17 TaxID=2589932 RepID=UPI0015E4601E|nr:hypothetical protein [Mesorhizobium sp. B2-4-17]